MIKLDDKDGAPEPSVTKPSRTPSDLTSAPVGEALQSDGPSLVGTPANDIVTMIERLAELRRKDILSEEEFTAKKAELLSRL